MVNLPQDIKDKRFAIKVTDSERTALHEIANKLGYKSTSQYVLDAALNPIIFIENVKPFLETNTHLSKAGTNINQIARKVNTYDFVMENDLKDIQKNLLQMRAYLKLLKDFRFFEKKNLEEIFKHGHD